jgi:menaquinone-dependent protoporphyrinogen oxidase
MKVLVSAASRHGATLEIATAIKNVLGQAGHEVDLVAPERVRDVEAYEAVVIGSSVYAGRWLASARNLVERETANLLERPVWLFSSGPIGDPPKPSQEPSDGVVLRERTHAVDHQVFEGKLDRRGLGIGEKAIVTVVGAPAGDYRPWDAILEWARWIAVALGHDTLPTAEAELQPLAHGVVL